MFGLKDRKFDQRDKICKHKNISSILKHAKKVQNKENYGLTSVRKKDLSVSSQLKYNKVDDI